MNLTLVDKNGNRVECECVYVEQFNYLPDGSNQVVLTFEDAQMAKEVFRFVWSKALSRSMLWLEDEKSKEEASPRV